MSHSSTQHRPRFLRDLTDVWRMPADTFAGLFRFGDAYLVAWGAGYDLCQRASALASDDVPAWRKFVVDATVTHAKGTPENGIVAFDTLQEAEAYVAEVASCHEV